MEPWCGCIGGDGHWSLVIGHWSLVIGKSGALEKNDK